MTHHDPHLFLDPYTSTMISSLALLHIIIIWYWILTLLISIAVFIQINTEINEEVNEEVNEEIYKEVNTHTHTHIHIHIYTHTHTHNTTWQHVVVSWFIFHTSGFWQEPEVWNIKHKNTTCCHLVFDIPHLRLLTGAWRVEYTTREDNMLSSRVLYSTRPAFDRSRTCEI